MPNFEKSTGYKMSGPSMIGGTQKHTDAVESKRAANVKSQSASCSCDDGSDCGCGGKPPGKFLMKAAGILIGANKRTQASKDAAEAHVGKGNKDALSKEFKPF